MAGDSQSSYRHDYSLSGRTSIFPEELPSFRLLRNRDQDSLHKSLRRIHQLLGQEASNNRKTRPGHDSEDSPPAADVQPDEDPDFRDEIQKHADDVAYLKRQLEESVKKNRAGRVRELCRLIERSGGGLCDEKWLGRAYGEPILALAVAYNSTAAARTLIQYGGQCLVCRKFDTPELRCLTALHLAIIKHNHDLVELMVGVLDENRKRSFLSVDKDIHQGAFASHPLSLAVMASDLRVLTLLLEHGADLQIKDPVTGNSLLHILAEQGLTSPKKAIKMLVWIVRSKETELWWSRRRGTDDDGRCLADVMLKARNIDGFTPMSYAVLIHSTEFAAALLSTNPVYTLPSRDVNPVHDQWLEMSEVDTSVGRSDTKAFSLLEMFTYSMSDRVLSLGEMPHVSTVVKRKWLGYRCRFIAWFVLHTCVMVAFTTFTAVGRVHPYVRRLVGHHRPNETVADVTNMDHFCLFLEVFVIAVSAAYAALDVFDVVRTVRRHRLWRLGSRLHFKYHLIIVLNHSDLFALPVTLFAFFALTTSVLRLLDSPLVGAFSALAAINGWMFTLFFIRLTRDLCIFTAIVHRTIFRELTNVTLLILIVVVAYAVGFFVLFSDKPTEIRTLQETYFRLIKVTVGLEEFDLLDDVMLAGFAKLLFLGFMLLSQVLLLNVLIAAMNVTYMNLASLDEAIRIHVLSGIILFMERRTPACLRPKCDFVQLDNVHDDRWYLGSKVTEKGRPWENFDTL